MTRVLITGASGFLGRYLLQQAPANQRILALGFQQSLNNLPDNTSFLTYDLTSGISQQLEDYSPDVIFHLAAMSSPEDCERYPEAARAITVDSTRMLVNFAVECKARLVFTSTDLVFRGEDAPYSETDLPTPINSYGALKLEAEELMLNRLPGKAVVARCPLMFGRSAPGRENFTAGIIRRLKEDISVPLFADEYRTPAWGSDVADALWCLALGLESGIFHLGGKERLSRYEQGKLLCAELKANPALLQASVRADVNSLAKRPRDCSLSSNRKLASQALPLPGFSERISKVLNES